MQINIREDIVIIEGYVNTVERNSKPLMSRIGRFIERIRKGAFSRALERNDDIHILLNHDWARDLGSTRQGNLELHEDNIGLHARAEIRDADVIEDARRGNLVGWSFGFRDRDVESKTEDGLPLRLVKDLDLLEVSILNKMRTPAYDGTLIMARSDDDVQYHGDAFLDEIEIREEQTEEAEPQAEQMQQENSEGNSESDGESDGEGTEADTLSIDYSKYEGIIAEMKQGGQAND